MADTASAIAEDLINFIHFSQVWSAMNGRAIGCAARLCLTAPSPELVVVANGACAMQTGRCGHHAGFSRSFRETLATRFPNLRQWHGTRRHSRKFRETAF